ncbi:MAG: hypothetical protein KGI08_10410, partial [Thaumarchaeota archaeon]|nr:hypothetical protein [Nitrososphaerota archaeon]
MSQISDVTALSGYQVQSQNLDSQIATLNSQISSLNAQLLSLEAQPQTVLVTEYDNGVNPATGDSIPPFTTTEPSSAAVQIIGINNQISSLQDQISSLQTKKTNLEQIITQLQKNITQYDTPAPVSAFNPSTISDTAHNIAS